MYSDEGRCYKCLKPKPDPLQQLAELGRQAEEKNNSWLGRMRAWWRK